MRSIMLLTSVLLVYAGPLPAADPDPWVGKTRADLVALLGEPHKVKASDEGEILTFKLLRMEEASIPPSGVRLLWVPGVKGTLGTMMPPGNIPQETAGIQPTDIDQQGRGTGGGVETDESYTVSWSNKDGVERSWQDGPNIRGKLTLKFTLNKTNKIVTWTVSPKKPPTSS